MSKLTDLLDSYTAGDITRDELVVELVGFTFSALPERPKGLTGFEREAEAEDFHLGFPHENTAEELVWYRNQGKLNAEDMSAITTALRG